MTNVRRCGGPRTVPAWVAPALVGLAACLAFTWCRGPVTVTTDEPNWLIRSDRFRTAFTEGELTGTDGVTLLSGAHQTSPGVTTMWAGTLGHLAVEGAERADLVEERPAGPRADQLRLRAGRAAVAVLCALAIGLLVWALSRLFGRGIGVVAGGLLCVEPFLAGHADLLHTDALVALWGALAVVAFAAAVAPGAIHRPSLVVSGVAGGVALLTKVGAAPLVFGGIAVVAGVALLERRQIVLRALGWWALVALAVSLLLWPALWLAPLRSVEQVLDAFGQLDPSDRTFFRDRLRRDPGPAYYPVVAVVRFTPWLLAGAAAGLAIVVARWRSRQPTGAATAPLTVAVLLAPLPYLATISVASQRYDRYLLPLVPFLAVAAGISVVALVEHLAAHPTVVRTARVTIAALLVLALGAVCATTYPSAYVSPLVGQRRAAHLVLLGQGEGIEQVGRWIERHDRARCDRVRVRAFGAQRAVVFPCGVLDTEGKLTDGPSRYDYALVYVSDRQRSTHQDEHAVIEREGELVFEARIGGVPYAELWSLERPP